MAKKKQSRSVDSQVERSASKPRREIKKHQSDRAGSYHTRLARKGPGTGKRQDDGWKKLGPYIQVTTKYNLEKKILDLRLPGDQSMPTIDQSDIIDALLRLWLDGGIEIFENEDGTYEAMIMNE